ncbi:MULTISPECIES: hypothetical protein [Chryseobacterium]|uniref:Uncharacterized protein n=1 Tax=Chryseobacterium geocarposphaerae TaxID=1416776 RepID=A0ABU1LAI6_9FLAO|nr:MULTISPECIES: hypothetical protein [Chryseobacterium]MDR6403735.1 hypothetical protein [Chryseobacterium geocarposphaerae]MDR6697289.1 hypothetical protein [Chryseobacterium ginsenosidimutans]
MKKQVLLLGALFVMSTAIYAQNGNVGINTTTPGTTLDVNGAITNRETAVAVAGNAATVPANISQVRLTGAATASVAITAPAAPNAGQRLIVYNNTTGGFGAVLNGTTIANGQAMEFAYSNGGWRATNGGAAASDTDWKILGNTGTNPATNFLGTTDNQGLAFRTNNTEKARILGNGNVGIGTTAPHTKLDLGTDVSSSKLAVYNDAAGSDFYGFGLSGGLLHFHAASATPTTPPDMVLHSSGQLGINIGVTNPTANLDVNGTARVRNTPFIPNTSIATPVYQDINGNISRSSPVGQGDVLSSGTTGLIAAGATATVLTGIPNGGAYTVYVSTASGCSQVALAEYWLLAVNNNGYSGLMGKSGMLGGNGITSPTFTETQNSSSVSWNAASCQDGGNTTSLDYRISITPGAPHSIQITNLGNVSRQYAVVLVRIGLF